LSLAVRVTRIGTPIDIERFMPILYDRSKTASFGQQPHTRKAEKDGRNGGEG